MQLAYFLHTLIDNAISLYVKQTVHNFIRKQSMKKSTAKKHATMKKTKRSGRKSLKSVARSNMQTALQKANALKKIIRAKLKA